jgi:CRP-like cAMP-binding protein
MFEAIKAYYLRLVPQLTETEWADFEQYLVVKQLQKGRFIVKAGQVCNYVSFINSGLVRLYYTVDGKDISIGFARAGDYTSEYESFLMRKAAAQNIEALTDCEVIDLAYEDMQTMYKRHSNFQEFGRKIAELLFIMLNERNTALLVLSPEERYRQMIQSNPHLLQVVPQYMLASYIGVTPEHLSRIRKKMAAK